ncbi:MAG TPA: PilZ domain-containing protein [Bryobacteraceae bacterium]|nr:PilZ domain-containing protein [Bryobacteraceae bacterium]
MSPIQVLTPVIDTRSHERIGIFPGPASRAEARERRQQQRFPIRAQAQYLLDGDRGSATTVNISSGGVCLKTADALPVGRRIQLWIDWPALLDQRCPLRLVIVGDVLRSDRGETVVVIKRYGFHLRPKSEPPFAA